MNKPSIYIPTEIWSQILNFNNGTPMIFTKKELENDKVIETVRQLLPCLITITKVNDNNDEWSRVSNTQIILGIDKVSYENQNINIEFIPCNIYPNKNRNGIITTYGRCTYSINTDSSSILVYPNNSLNKIMFDVKKWINGS